MDYLTADQLRSLHDDLGGNRNTRIFMASLEKEGFVKSFLTERVKVYYLSKKGRQEVGSRVIRKKTVYIGHYLLRNQLYLSVMPETWRSEPKIEFQQETLRPDAVFTKKDRKYFLEVDITRSMADNREKIRLYRELRDSGAWKGEFPIVMFVTTTEYRRKALDTELEGLKHIILTEVDLR
ncbi:replication-relaxation family protein [Mechercharimyces sp. CAU 1602]|uniref:replication-relaxation family protein n=1 Tax=Mechercharimyces sp. CAU 1602 TaxID=2973933 RepID=UPI0021638739|nr:replication-relaxation family protein [Mechercharimyces sp. CAU 1602]